MWQRWNQSTHIFEKSDNNGASWTPLGLSADIITEGALAKARQHAQTPYKDEANTFTQLQTLGGIRVLGGFEQTVSGTTAIDNYVTAGGAASWRFIFPDAANTLGYGVGAGNFGIYPNGGTGNYSLILNKNGSIQTGGQFKYIAPGTDVISDAVTAMSNGDAIILGPGTYTQTVAITIPPGITLFSIVGQGPAITKIRFSNNTKGIASTVGFDDGYRIINGRLAGFSMHYDSSTTSTEYGVELWGHEYDTAATPGLILEDITIEFGSNAKCWATCVRIVNCRGLLVLNRIFIRREANGRSGVGIQLESCMEARISQSFIMCCGTAISLIKASDGLIYSSVKHGCEDIQIDNTTMYIFGIGVNLGYKCFTSKLSTLEFARPATYGIYEDISSGSENGGYHLIDRCYFDNDGNHTTGAFVLLERPGSRVSGSQFSNAGQTINGVVFQANANLCNAAHNIFRALGSGGGAGVLVYGDADKVEGNVFESTSAAGYDINIQSGAVGTLVAHNMIDQSINDSGTSTTLANNPAH